VLEFCVVFPTAYIPTVWLVCAAVCGPEMSSEALTPTEMPPMPRKLRLRASAVPLDVSVVFDDAYSPTDWFVCVGTV
jgi:hypothetical protein